MTGGGGQDGPDESDGGEPRGGVGGGPEASCGECWRNPRRGCDGVCQAQELVRAPSRVRPMASVSVSVFGSGVGIGIGIESQGGSIPIPIATPTPRRGYAPPSGCGFILGRGPRVGLVPRPTRGYRLQRLRRWGGGSGWGIRGFRRTDQHDVVTGRPVGAGSRGRGNPGFCSASPRAIGVRRVAASSASRGARI